MSSARDKRRTANPEDHKGYLILVLVTALWALGGGLVFLGVGMAAGTAHMAGALVTILGLAGLSLLVRFVRAT
jgi:hypothetical protein